MLYFEFVFASTAVTTLTHAARHNFRSYKYPKRDYVVKLSHQKTPDLNGRSQPSLSSWIISSCHHPFSALKQLSSWPKIHWSLETRNWDRSFFRLAAAAVQTKEIEKLLNRWACVSGNDGDYVFDWLIPGMGSARISQFYNFSGFVPQLLRKSKYLTCWCLYAEYPLN